MDLKPFSGPTFCVKCASHGCLVRYCEVECLRGLAGGAGGPFLSGETIGAAAQPHLHRKCQACGHEWLERCADETDAEADRCGFCLRDEPTVQQASGPGSLVMHGPNGKICTDCVRALHSAAQKAAGRQAPEAVN